jgi:hypothetical protein
MHISHIYTLHIGVIMHMSIKHKLRGYFPNMNNSNLPRTAHEIDVPVVRTINRLKNHCFSMSKRLMIFSTKLRLKLYYLILLNNTTQYKLFFKSMRQETIFIQNNQINFVQACVIIKRIWKYI